MDTQSVMCRINYLSIPKLQPFMDSLLVHAGIKVNPC